MIPSRMIDVKHTQDDPQTVLCGGKGGSYANFALENNLEVLFIIRYFCSKIWKVTWAKYLIRPPLICMGVLSIGQR